MKLDSIAIIWSIISGLERLKTKHEKHNINTNRKKYIEPKYWAGVEPRDGGIGATADDYENKGHPQDLDIILSRWKWPHGSVEACLTDNIQDNASLRLRVQSTKLS